ncbi:MAG: restriction endonuclease [Candidatus Marinimicrobia bacterium]|jgi:restriction system protein|nr:restriction endonuclease [Candidatus Neomarinimicrobiota bacterium]MBT5271244.1 restriction endonuclease [Candidatus Neomarinimicrobiota bacterium]
MPIPKYSDIQVPALKLLTENDSLLLREFEAPLAEHFGLTESEVSQEYASGNGKIFYDRVSWALSYMNMVGLVRKPKRGTYQISDLGEEKLLTPDRIGAFIRDQISKRTLDDKTQNSPESPQFEEDNLTPQEELYKSYTQIQITTYSEIIDVILSKTPREFEKLVVMLLQCMGYGGEIKSSGKVTNYTNDKGIDGIIKEDILGLGRIHIQAKRYNRNNSVGREEIQKFVGALATAQSNKGVFITTSSYSKGAIEYAESLNGATTVILIDGAKLAEYIYEYELGMQVEQTIKIKKMDSDFWDSMDVISEE